MFNSRPIACLTFVLALSALLPAGGYAQPGAAYPTRAITIVVPFSPGGGNDLIARLVAAKFTEDFGHPAVVDNKPGAGGALGSEIVARAAPDGHTLIVGNNSTIINQAFNPKLSYDIIRDFTPISLIAVGRELLLTGPNVPASSVQEFVALAKARPGQLNYGSGGSGSHTHLVAELFKFATGTNIVHIPYKGAAPGYNGLLVGEIQMVFASTAGSIQYIQSGRLKALGITGVKRSDQLPDLPTLPEQGVKGFETALLYLFLGPANLPRPVVARLNQEIVKIVSAADIKQKFIAGGTEPVGSTPEECMEAMKNELAKWTNFVKQTGLKVEVN